MSEGNLDYLEHSYWRKRIHQLKQELRSNTSEVSLVIPEQVKTDGTELKPKRNLNSVKPTLPKPAIASAPSRREG